MSSWTVWGEQPSMPHTPSAMMSCLITGSERTEPSDYGLKLWVKINLL
jgi:hypothetical protein